MVASRDSSQGMWNVPIIKALMGDDPEGKSARTAGSLNMRSRHVPGSEEGIAAQGQLHARHYKTGTNTLACSSSARSVFAQQPLYIDRKKNRFCAHACLAASLIRSAGTQNMQQLPADYAGNHFYVLKRKSKDSEQDIKLDHGKTRAAARC
jgi:hypothetical protein